MGTNEEGPLERWDDVAVLIRCTHFSAPPSGPDCVFLMSCWDPPHGCGHHGNGETLGGVGGESSEPHSGWMENSFSCLQVWLTLAGFRTDSWSPNNPPGLMISVINEQLRGRGDLLSYCFPMRAGTQQASDWWTEETWRQLSSRAPRSAALLSEGHFLWRFHSRSGSRSRTPVPKEVRTLGQKWLVFIQI